MIIRDLGACTQGPSRVAALGRNHMLWSLLIKDLARGDNTMPDGIKAELIKLGLWAMQYSTLATLKDVPLQPLIDVNCNVVEGLRAQGSGATAPVAATTSASFAI